MIVCVTFILVIIATHMHIYAHVHDTFFQFATYVHVSTILSYCLAKCFSLVLYDTSLLCYDSMR